MPILTSIWGGLTRTFGKISLLLFSTLSKLPLRLTLTIFLLLMIAIPAVKESIKNKTPLPFIKEVGGRLLIADSLLKEKTINIIQTPSNSFLGRMWQFLSLTKELWFIYVNFWIFYFLISKFQTPFIITLLTLILLTAQLQTVYSTWILHEPYKIPFEGVFLFGKNIPYFISPIIKIFEYPRENWELVNNKIVEMYGSAENRVTLWSEK